MKAKEEVIFDDVENKVIVKKTHLNDPYIEEAARLKSMGVGMTGDNRLAGILPMHVVSEWIKEAGLDWSDQEACREVIKRKMLSGDFDKLRVWEGRY